METLNWVEQGRMYAAQARIDTLNLRPIEEQAILSVVAAAYVSGALAGMVKAAEIVGEK